MEQNKRPGRPPGAKNKRPRIPALADAEQMEYYFSLWTNKIKLYADGTKQTTRPTARSKK
jgi:hypothetical protein